MNHLDTETKFEIISKLNTEELLNICDSSKDFREYCNDKYLWKKIFEENGLSTDSLYSIYKIYLDLFEKEKIFKKNFLELIKILEKNYFKDSDIPLEEETWGISFNFFGVEKYKLTRKLMKNMDNIIKKKIFQPLYDDQKEFLKENSVDLEENTDNLRDQCILYFSRDKKYHINIEKIRFGHLIGKEENYILEKDVFYEFVYFLVRNKISFYDVRGNFIIFQDF